MPIKVPIYQSTVTAKKNEALPIVAPETPPPAAFGMATARGMQELGQAGANLGMTLNDISAIRARHAAEMDKRKNEEVLNGLETDFKLNLDNVLNDPETEDRDGVNVPRGLLNRPLALARGATVEYDSKVDDLAKSYQGRFQDPEMQAKLNQSIRNMYAATRDQVSRHESMQGQESEKRALEGNLASNVDLVAKRPSPANLKIAIDNGRERMVSVYASLGHTKDEIGQMVNKYAYDAIDGATRPLISPDPAPALSLLESAKDQIDVNSYDKLKENILAQSKQMAAQAKAAENERFDQANRQAMIDYLDNKYTQSENEYRFRNNLIDQPTYMRMTNILGNPEMASMRDMPVSNSASYNKIREAQLSGKYTPRQLDEMVQEGVASGNIGEGNGLNGDDVKYLFGQNAAAKTPEDAKVEAAANELGKYAQDYFDQDRPFFGRSAYAKNAAKQSDEIKNMFYRQVDKEKATGARVEEIKQEVFKTFVAKNYPELGKYDQAPDVIYTIDGKIRSLTVPGGKKSTLKPKWRIMPAETSAEK